MRVSSMIMLVLAFSILLVGCNRTCPVEEKEDDVVSFSNATYENASISEQNKTLDKISFILTNDKDYEADCDINIALRNGTNESVKRTNIGLFGAGEKKKISLQIEMFEGESEFYITPDCHRP